MARAYRTPLLKYSSLLNSWFRYALRKEHLELLNQRNDC